MIMIETRKSVAFLIYLLILIEPSSLLYFSLYSSVIRIVYVGLYIYPPSISTLECDGGEKEDNSTYMCLVKNKRG